MKERMSSVHVGVCLSIVEPCVHRRPFLTSDSLLYIGRLLESWWKAEPYRESENTRWLFPQPHLQLSKGLCPPIRHSHPKLWIQGWWPRGGGAGKSILVAKWEQQRACWVSWGVGTVAAYRIQRQQFHWSQQQCSHQIGLVMWFELWATHSPPHLLCCCVFSVPLLRFCEILNAPPTSTYLMCF